MRQIDDRWPIAIFAATFSLGVVLVLLADTETTPTVDTVSTSASSPGRLDGMTKHEGIAQALPAFHAKVGTIHKQTQGQYGSFADLSTILSEVIPHLCECGLSVTQTFEPHGDDGEMLLVTTLHHISGETVVSKLPLLTITPAGRNNPLHAWGAAVTYQRRYALLAILNLAAGIVDDDADSADGSSRSRSAPRQPSRQSTGGQNKSGGIDLIAVLRSFEHSMNEAALIEAGKRARELPDAHVAAAKKAYAARLAELRRRAALVATVRAGLHGDHAQGLTDLLGRGGVTIEVDDDVDSMSTDLLEQAQAWLHERQQ